MSCKVLRNLIMTTMISAMIPTISFATEGVVDGNAVRLRKEPSSDSKIITLLEKGSTGEVKDQKDGWYNVTVGKYTGWVSGDYFKVEEEAAVVTNDENLVETVTELKNIVVDTAVVNIRKEPTTDSTLLGQTQKGQLLTVVSQVEVENEVWYKIELAENSYGYIREDLITDDISKVNGSGMITASAVNFRKEASTEADSLGKIYEGALITITGVEGDWYKVSYNNKNGYVHSEYVKVLVSGVTSRSGASLSKAQKVVQYAKENLGKKYVWGATGPNSFDCSGLMQYIYKKVGINLNRVSRDQATQGVAVSKSNLQPGDLVFFRGINSSSSSTYISHVGVYIGNGEFIHASNPTRGVVKDSLNSDYYSSHYVKARRIIR